ncbi:MAG: AAA family ATPase [Saprospiraceae bacterium]
MKIKCLFINNYKSLVNFELVEPNPFSVFVGPNAAGKSNVFEALEFLSYGLGRPFYASDLFGGPSIFLNKQFKLKERIPHRYEINFKLNFDEIDLQSHLSCFVHKEKWIVGAASSAEKGKLINNQKDELKESTELRAKEDEFIESFSRLFIGKTDLNKLNISSQNKLRIDSRNLEPVLHRILQDEAKREEITEWLELLIPGLEKVEVAKSDLSGDYFLRIFEKHLSEPIGKNLISDGTYNILALLTAVYQSDEPQFLCIEEPENGLNPYVIRTLVGFFRQMCEEKGHYIWLNTHSATLVRELRNEEIILIDKKEGITQAKQIPADFNRYDLEMDEAWLTNALGGGLPW